MTQQERLIELFGKSWYDQLKDHLHSNEFNIIGQRLLQRRKEVEVYPQQSDIFKAFRKTPFDKVKVVLIGLHPYTSGRKATGLAFGVDLNVTDKLTTSIKDIHKEIENDLDILNIDFDSTLEGLAEQGVLLLNLALTADMNSNHLKLWKPFMDEVFKKLYSNEDIVYVIIGKDTLDNIDYPFMNMKEYNRCFCDSIINSGFPSYCNAVLYMRNIEEVNWNIKNK